MKKFALLLAAGIISLLFLFIPEKMQKPGYSAGTEDNPNARNDYEFMVMRDPVTNSVPEGIRRREAELSRLIPTLTSYALAKGKSIQSLIWSERGPDNIGGRTRTFAADIEHPGVLIAGGVDGGIWKSTNDGGSWFLKLRPEQTHSTTCIDQDKRPGKKHIWYVGTGEFRGSTTNNTRWGSFYHGDGIYKSTDDGESWEILPSTASGTPHIADAFDFIWTVKTNPANTAQDEVFAATWKGIYRSTDGGATWNVAKASDPGTLNTNTAATDVAVTSAGVIYAHTRESGVLKLWRSTDGVNWNSIAPANFPTSSGRVVFAAAPSDENILYIFVQGPNNTPATAGHQIWKYTYNASGGIWENRSANLPSDLSTQTGYDQVIHVKPDNPNFVILGGTDLFRSTDGFSSTANITVIGGYPYYYSAGGTHHPDIQGGMFKPTNYNVYYSTTDGGLHRADDILMSGTMNWVSMNNGYNVTQLYSVSISPDSGDTQIAAGAQDNGSLATDNSGYWYEVYGGDGTVVELAPVADDRIYTQYQNGPLFRLTRAQQDVTYLTPSGSARPLFVNPIALDPNNSNILYYGAGSTVTPAMYSGIWRNNNVKNGSTSTGWAPLGVSDVGTVTTWTRRVSTIGISKSNQENVVYIGTTDGIIKRIDNANSLSPSATDITPPGLNGGTQTGGFVRCIAVDPLNSAHALAAFGNYNFRNLWVTTDGGANWTDVEGNLAGADGPSVRWATFVYAGDELNVFIGTSIGLLMTSRLQGDSTVWVHAAAEEIGNVLIAYMDYRESDRTLVVGTHGRGVFSTQIPDGPMSADESHAVPQSFTLAQNYPNPFNPSTTIRYVVAGNSYVKLNVFDVRGKMVAKLVDEMQSAGTKEVQWNASGMPSGVYYYKLQTGDDKFAITRKMALLK